MAAYVWHTVFLEPTSMLLCMKKDQGISFGVKQMGARNAGNPHVACDVEGAGDVVWVGTRATPARQPSTLPMRPSTR